MQKILTKSEPLTRQKHKSHSRLAQNFSGNFSPGFPDPKNTNFVPGMLKQGFQTIFSVKMLRNDQNSREKNAQTSKISGTSEAKRIILDGTLPSWKFLFNTGHGKISSETQCKFCCQECSKTQFSFNRIFLPVFARIRGRE